MPIKFIHRKKEIILQQEMTLEKAYRELDLPQESYLALRNGELITEKEMLHHGDEVRLIAVISGGSTK